MCCTGGCFYINVHVVEQISEKSALFVKNVTVSESLKRLKGWKTTRHEQFQCMCVLLSAKMPLSGWFLKGAQIDSLLTV